MNEPNIYKIFCDESCHLEHDGADVMVLGALHCSADKATELTRHIKWLRHHHNYKPELKWSKLNKHQWPLYQDLIDLVLNNDSIHFKATIVSNKQTLDHQQYNAGSRSDFYYKMFYYTLRDFIKDENQYRIYLDYMDTLGAEKTSRLRSIISKEKNIDMPHVSTTIVRSHEAQLIQLCDLLIGAVAYRARSDIPRTSRCKMKFVAYLEGKIGRCLDIPTPPWEKKFNIFRFVPRGSTC